MNTEYPRIFQNAELRVVDTDGQRPKIVGYAAVFNSLSADLGGFKEKIMPGAFADALSANEEVLALVEHNPEMVLGRRSKGTLALKEDAKGLYVEIDPPNTRAGNDAVENIRRGDIGGMSFRFPRGAKDTWERVGSENIRSLHKLGVLEVTLTAIPAYPTTSANLRSLPGVDPKELGAYYDSEIRKLTPPPEKITTPVRDSAERRLRLETAEMRCCGYDVPDPCLADVCASVLSQCRYTFDTAQRAISFASDEELETDDSDVQAAADAAAEATKCIERLQKFVEAMNAVSAADSTQA